MSAYFSAEALSAYWTMEALYAFFQVVLIDLVLAGDNAIVIGLAAAGLPKEQRNRAILWGIIAATVLRIVFASITVQLLAITGILLFGGLLLLYVCWKMWAELREPPHDIDAIEALAEHDPNPEGSVTDIADGAANATVEATGHAPPRKTYAQAIWQIIIADVSMSLDNVLAVAGAARDYPLILIFGLALSIALMGIAATFIARLLQKHRWIAYVGLAVILYVALEMSYRGILDVLPYVRGWLGA